MLLTDVEGLKLSQPTKSAFASYTLHRDVWYLSTMVFFTVCNKTSCLESAQSRMFAVTLCP